MALTMNNRYCLSNTASHVLIYVVLHILYQTPIVQCWFLVTLVMYSSINMVVSLASDVV